MIQSNFEVTKAPSIPGWSVKECEMFVGLKFHISDTNLVLSLEVDAAENMHDRYHFINIVTVLGWMNVKYWSDKEYFFQLLEKVSKVSIFAIDKRLCDSTIT